MRHLDAALLEKVFSIAIGTELNSADAGTKNLTRSRFYGKDD